VINLEQYIEQHNEENQQTELCEINLCDGGQE
jgi:hypothetical protein